MFPKKKSKLDILIYRDLINNLSFKKEKSETERKII